MQVACTRFLLLHGSPHLTPGCPSGVASVALEVSPLGFYNDTLLAKDRSPNLRRSCLTGGVVIGLGMNPLGNLQGFHLE